MKTLSNLTHALGKSVAVAFLVTTLTQPFSTSLAVAGMESPVRIATMLTGAEVTGLSSNSLGELFLNVQHPGGKNVFKDGVQPALLGYVHGFDSASFSGSGMAIPPQSARDVVNVAEGSYVIFGKAGDRLGSGQVLGGVYDTSGKLMYVSNTPDFNGFVHRGNNSAYLYTAWEGGGRDGASAVSRLSLTRVDGKRQADLSNSRMVDLSSVHGGAVLCSGIVSPWGTPLLSEEYFFYGTATWNHPDNHDEDERASFEKGNDITFIKPKNMTAYLAWENGQPLPLWLYD